MEYYAVTKDLTYFNLGIFTGERATDDAVDIAYCILGDDYKQLSSIVSREELKQVLSERGVI